MKPTLTLVFTLLLVSRVPLCAADLAAASDGNPAAQIGKSRFTIEIKGLPIDVFAYRPSSFTRGPLLVVMHGMKRNAETYRDHAIPLAEQVGALVIAPLFDVARFPTEAYQHGNVVRDGLTQPASEWTYLYVERLIGEMRAREGREDMPVTLIGHSAGGQFLTRLAAFLPGDATRVVAANPGTLLFPTREMPFAYGFGELPAELGGDDAIRRYLAAPLTLFLGTADTLSENLDVGPVAMRQGGTRIERGRACFALARDLAQRHGWPFHWRLLEAPGIGHDGAQMLAHPRARAALFGPKGRLVIMGGGTTPPGLYEKLVAMAGGTAARVLVVPLASVKDDGRATMSHFTEAGAAHVSILSADNPTAALNAVRTATLVWLSGGSQSRLVTALRRLNVVDALLDRYLDGTVIAGTSAGAAAMSQVMIAGNPEHPGGPPEMSEGLGLWPDAIVDQHFVSRGREPRLRSAVQTHPALPGVGIDESTYVVVSGDEIEVGGASSVTVLDARWSAEPARSELRAGSRWQFRTRLD